MKDDLFSFRDYKKYLKSCLPTSGKDRGIRSRLAATLRCRSAYVSQVLNGEIHFSLEHAAQICEFLGHTEAEAQYFLLLVHHARAGTNVLRRHYESQLTNLLSQRQKIRERIQVQESLGPVEQARYYSSWHYSAVHIGLAVPEMKTKEAIASKLGVPISRVSEILEFLCQCGLAIQKGAQYELGTARIHLPADSPLISKHHINWRLKAIQATDGARAEDLRYSGVLALSRADRDQIRSIILNAIERTEKILKDSHEETLVGLAFDLFEV